MSCCAEQLIVSQNLKMCFPSGRTFLFWWCQFDVLDRILLSSNHHSAAS